MSRLLLVVLALVTCSSFTSAKKASLTFNEDTKVTHVIDYLEDAIAELVPEDVRSVFYEQYYAEYDLLDGLNINSLLGMLGKPYADNGTCHMCNSLMGLGRQVLTTKEILVGLLGGVCKETDSLSKRTCTGLLERLADPIVWLFVNTKLQNAEICALLVGHGCLEFLDFKGDNKTVTWQLPLPPKREYKPVPAVAGKVKKVLHLTDIHLDLWYTVGSPVYCNDPLCCRSTSADTHHKNISAGFWHQVGGSCDTPLHFLVDSLKQIAAQHPDLDAVFWTGDNVPHDVWNTTQQINLRHIHTVSGAISVAFNNIPVIPVLGNHEAHPINMYIPEAVREKDANQSMTWLYKTLVDDFWSRWIVDEEAKKTFLRGGYYSKMASPSWKVIVLNSNIAQKQNFWILYDPVDPDGQLAWLIKELDHAESIGAKVSILGHVPPKHENYDAWVDNYIRIMDRYSEVITGTYYGHTHNDEVAVLYNHEKKPISVAYISGSLTTYSNLNPQYTIFDMDTNGTPLDSTVYLTDIDEANRQHAAHPSNSTSPKWRIEYHPKKTYRLADMSPASWDAFLKEAETDLDLAELYVGHYHRYSKEWPARSIEEVKAMLEGVKRYSPYMHLEKNISDDDGLTM